MSDAKAEARQRAVDYMARLLQLNPLQAGDEIIAVRSEALGLAKKVKVSEAMPAEAQRADRRALLDNLESLRAQFWTLPIEQLWQRVNSLSGEGFADVEAAIARLRVVADYRPRFVALVQKSEFDGELFSSLKEVLTRSPRDTAVLREQVLAKFRVRERRGRGRKMVELLQREMPAIYELEADWFNTLYRQKAQSWFGGGGAGTLGSGAGSSAKSYWWVVVLVLASARAAVVFSTHSDKARQPAPASQPYIPPPRRETSTFPFGDTRERRDSRQNGFEVDEPYLPTPQERLHQQIEEMRAQTRFGGSEDKDVWKPYSDPYEPPAPSPPTPGAQTPGRQPPRGRMAPFGTPRAVPIPGSPPHGRFPG